MFDILEVIPDLQLPREEDVCDPNTFLSQIHFESQHSN